MASFVIHLAIGKRYYEKSNLIQDKNEFYNGIVDPDLVKDKALSHYTGQRDNNDLISFLLKKVQLYEYLKKENIDSDYQKGVFLHLVTDYLFFNNFLDKDYLKSTPYSDFIKDLYYSYDITKEYLERKYHIEYPDCLEEINDNIERTRREKTTLNEIRKIILSYNELDKFIEYISDINLEQYKTKILTKKKNILP